jgi:phage baseplate assembly protein W
MYWKDIDISLDKKQDGDIKDDIDFDAVQNSIENILQTFQGSRRMLPTFALGLYDLLFEQIDDITAMEIGNRILDITRMWDDRVIVENITITPKPDKNYYKVLFTFRIENINESRTIDTIISAL